MASQSIDLSIIIVNWNTRDITLNCLRSVYENLKDGPTFEVILVDNGSKDGSVESIKADFPQGILIENKKNLGFAKANNLALERMRGRYALFLNSDVMITPNSIQRMKEFMDLNPNVGAVGVQLLREDGSKQNSVANFPSLATELLNKSLLRKMFPRKYFAKDFSHSPYEVESLIGACIMVRKETIDEIGPLDEDYFFFLEETDWCFRMKKAGWKIFHLPHIQVYHFQGQSVKRELALARIEYFRSRYKFFEKHRGKNSVHILKVGLFVKLFVDIISMFLLSSIPTKNRIKYGEKLHVLIKVFMWHLRLCPDQEGLKNLDC